MVNTLTFEVCCILLIGITNELRGSRSGATICEANAPVEAVQRANADDLERLVRPQILTAMYDHRILYDPSRELP